MELIRDLLRDLVGVIFPGGLFVIFTLWLFFGILIILIPSEVFTVYSIGDKSVSFLALLIFSYIAGQSLRIKQLNHLEKACTETYRKKRMKNESDLSEKDFEESIKTLDKVEEDYYAGSSTLDRLVEVYKQHNDKFKIWEEFPYPYLLRGRRLLLQSKGYIQFFEKYDKQGITKDPYFFNFCKSVIYEYSSSLKEELIRQEALVRLFAGIYYVLKYGKFAGAITLLLHSAIIVAFYLFGGISFLPNLNITYSWGIFLISAFGLVTFWYLNKEILDRLRFMRAKELNLAFDGFYIICNRYELDIG